MLVMLGYTVICTKNRRGAIDCIAAELSAHRHIAGMIFDLTIPGGMGGKEAIIEVRRLSPNTPVFVTSGYAEDPIMANPTKYGFTASMGKPFLFTELLQLLNKHMNIIE